MRDMAANWNFVIIIAPSNFDVPSPIRPLLRFTMKIFLASIDSLMLNEILVCPTIFLIKGLAKNCPTLFWIGATASVANRSGYLLNSSTQNERMTGSLSCTMTHLR